MPRERTPAWARRRDKNGGYARTRRWEKALDRKGPEDREVAVASITVPERLSDGKGALTIFRDVVMRKRRVRRPRPALDFTDGY